MKPDRQNWGLWEQIPLLPCFTVAMLSASAIVSDRWVLPMLWPALAILLISAALSLVAMRWMAAHIAQKGLAAVDIHLLGLKSLKPICKMDRLVVAGLSIVQTKPRHLSNSQQFLDRSLQPLMFAMARQGQHRLCILAAEAFQEMDIQADNIADIYHGFGGSVSAIWRGHAVSLFASTPAYGDREMSLCLCIDGETAALIRFDEALEVDAPLMIENLKRAGVDTLILDRDEAPMLICAARQLQATIMASVETGSESIAVRQQFAVGKAPLLLQKLHGRRVQFAQEDRDGTFALVGPASKQPLLICNNLRGVVVAAECAKYVSSLTRRATSAIMIVHSLALGAFFAGATNGALCLAIFAAFLLIAYALRPIFNIRFQQLCRSQLANPSDLLQADIG